MITTVQFGKGGYDESKPHNNIIVAFDEEDKPVSLAEAKAFSKNGTEIEVLDIKSDAVDQAIIEVESAKDLEEVKVAVSNFLKSTKGV